MVLGLLTKRSNTAGVWAGTLDVTRVSDDSPAQKGGVQVYVILTRFEDQILTHPSQLRTLVQQLFGPEPLCGD